jgi:hypothetical protein
MVLHHSMPDESYTIHSCIGCYNDIADAAELHTHAGALAGMAAGYWLSSLGPKQIKMRVKRAYQGGDI